MTGTTAEPAVAVGPWKVLIVDDAEEIHNVTRLVLSRFEFDGRGLDLLDAYSASEAMGILREEDDIALILLDVVMETDRAGLDLAREIRGTLGNTATRIILRTGQPGQAPERDVILNYDINDYKEKTELSAQKLFTMLVSSLRDYQRIVCLQRCKTGLRRILGDVDRLRTLGQHEEAARTALDHLSRLLGRHAVNGCAATPLDGTWTCVATAGSWDASPGTRGVLDGDLAGLCARAAASSAYIQEGARLAVACPSGDCVLVLDCPEPLSRMDREMVDTFRTAACAN